ncbi:MULTISPECIES: DNA methyltransferase [unclassified Exiguobacterium]|uniref:DNA methyltransferase n=1 Tax=unclassified Exiguobacterium TaxID=2644629 RepID=UPI00203669EB|nr:MULTISPECIES: DNA methyltransferase [unclassified Exiguobacterium]
MSVIEPKIFEEIKKVLVKFNNKYFINEELNKASLSQDLRNYNEELLTELFKIPFIRKYYIKKINKDNFMLIDQLEEALLYSNYWDTSYTRYENRIGLGDESTYISDSEKIVLNFPFKDCILTASMTKEDKEEGYDNAFLNEVIEKGEIDQLLDTKILKNIVTYDEKGKKNNVISFDKNKDNLVLKGNNLLALHTIKSKYNNSLDVIYIDPPYNVPSSNNSFTYNNNFNHSTWLTFMKNRLEVSKEMLKRENGVLIIAIDENEVSYLGVLLDEIYTDYEKHLITVVHNPRGVQGTNFSYTNEFMYFVFPKGKKIIENRKLSDSEITLSNLRNWGGESLRGDGKNTFFPILIKDDKIIGFGEVCAEDFHPKQTEYLNGVYYVYPIDPQGVERKWRYARQTIESIQEMLHVKKRSDGNFEVMIGKDFGQYKTVWQSNLYDSSVHGKQLLKKLVPNANFSFPKSVYAVYDALYAVVKNRKEALILDFFGGSGTTAHAVQMLNYDDGGNRKFVSIEQMDYISTVQVPRLLAEDDKKRNDGFVYAELFPKNMGYFKEIIKSKNSEELKAVYERMLDNSPYNIEADIDYRADLSKIDWTRNFNDNKRLLLKILDKNGLYFNYCDIEDEFVKEFLTEDEFKFNKIFYEGVELID